MMLSTADQTDVESHPSTYDNSNDSDETIGGWPDIVGWVPAACDVSFVPAESIQQHLHRPTTQHRHWSDATDQPYDIHHITTFSTQALDGSATAEMISDHHQMSQR